MPPYSEPSFFPVSEAQILGLTARIKSFRIAWSYIILLSISSRVSFFIPRISVPEGGGGDLIPSTILLKVLSVKRPAVYSFLKFRLSLTVLTHLLSDQPLLCRTDLPLHAFWILWSMITYGSSLQAKVEPAHIGPAGVMPSEVMPWKHLPTRLRALSRLSLKHRRLSYYNSGLALLKFVSNMARRSRGICGSFALTPIRFLKNCTMKLLTVLLYANVASYPHDQKKQTKSTLGRSNVLKIVQAHLDHIPL